MLLGLNDDFVGYVSVRTCTLLNLTVFSYSAPPSVIWTAPDSHKGGCSCTTILDKFHAWART